jgi:hypothetical protein
LVYKLGGPCATIFLFKKWKIKFPVAPAYDSNFIDSTFYSHYSMNLQSNFFLGCVAQQANSGQSASVLSFLDHRQLDKRTHALTRACARMHKHTCTPGRTPLNGRSARHTDRYLHSTQQTQETNFTALDGIRTCSPSSQAAADLRLRSHGPRDLYTNRPPQFALRVCVCARACVRASTFYLLREFLCIKC